MRRCVIIGAAALCVLALTLITRFEMPTKFVWNATASVPIGLYQIESPLDFNLGDLVAAGPTAVITNFMVERNYLTADVLLMKRIAALPGQRVCRNGSTILVDDVAIAQALERDTIGRRLPIWKGCRVIAHDQLLLVNVGVSESLDGRYFGPFPTRSVVGKARPIWTDQNGDGRFVWGRTPEN